MTPPKCNENTRSTTGEMLYGTHRPATADVDVEIGRMGIPGEPGDRAVRLSAVDGQEIVLTDPSAALELMLRLKRSVRYLAGM